MSEIASSKASTPILSGMTARFRAQYRLRLLLGPALLFLCLFYLYPLAKLALISLERTPARSQAMIMIITIFWLIPRSMVSA